MATTEDLIDFSIIENQKENIQSLPSGRSAKALATLYSPPSLTHTPSPCNTQNLNDTVRQSYETELLTLDDSDDPLDIYDRYVKWTLSAYPSPQAKEAQLLPLLERATKSFLSSPHYKNDPRYLRLWLHYISLFADAPRETFAFLARHGVGAQLALYYEEFAAWLERQGRWAQAEEVFELGVQREARPVERLVRKMGEFQHRWEVRRAQGAEEDGPSSPALPVVRAALAEKVDPFATAAAVGPADPQARDRAAAARVSKAGRQKLAIFADDGEKPPKMGANEGAKAWDSIGSLAESKKENTVEARSWAGETLKTGKANVGVPKMMVFKDESSEVVPAHETNETESLREQQQIVNPKTGRTECVFVNLEAVYPNSSDPYTAEYCFEELRARHRGWLDYDWKAIRKEEDKARAKAQAAILKVHKDEEAPKPSKVRAEKVAASLAKDLQESVLLNDENAPPSQEDMEKAKMARKLRKEERANRTRKIRVMEVRGETQTVQTNLASPTGPKIKRKKSAEPTMTLCTKEAMDEIYDIFNQPLKTEIQQTEEAESAGESDDDDDYTSAGESTGTGRISGPESEYGDETTAADFTEARSTGNEEDNEATSNTGWTDYGAAKHDADAGEGTRQSEASSWEVLRDDEQPLHQEDLVTPTSPEHHIANLPTRFIPLPPNDYEAPTKPYRDQAQMAQSRLPFMTPIVEKTESSLGAATAIAEKDYFNSKTPCRQMDVITPTIPEVGDGEPWSSPFGDVTNDENARDDGKIPQPALPKSTKAKVPLAVSASTVPTIATANGRGSNKEAMPKGPIIKDAQCNPVDEHIRQTILDQIQPPLSSYEGYHDWRTSSYGKGAEIRKFTKAVTKMSKNSNDKTATNLILPPVLRFEGTDREYTVKRELGKGAFAPVYLVEGTTTEPEDEDAPAQMGKGTFGLARNRLEAIKMEDPPSAWEFYMLRQAKRRLGVSRAAESIIHAYEMHLFRDEGYLVEEYRDQGTLLNLVNVARADVSGGGVMDEQLAMFFAVELFRTVEALHARGLIHGDLKPDNVLVRLEDAGAWDSQYRRDGTGGWAAKGVALIDFGRGVDMRAFAPAVQFVADWKTGAHDCAEMRELRPWTYQVDYHGLAGVVHSLLFGKYIETVAERAGASLGAGATRRYRIREGLKRYWQTEIWGEVFDLLLNALMHLGGEEGARLPVLKGMRRCRERMEEWLEENCERGVGLRSLIRRVEGMVRDRRRL